MSERTPPPRVAELLQPISPAAPTGEDAKYDPDYELIKGELGKLEATSGGVVDWNKVARAGANLLRARTKDLMIAAYVAMAWGELEGLRGVADGVALLAGLVEGFWDGLFPKRPRARGGALTAYIARVEPALGGCQVGAPDRARVLGLDEDWKRLSRAVGDGLGGDAPVDRGVRQALRSLVASLPAEAPPPPPPPPPPRAAAPTPPPTPAPTPTPAPAPAIASDAPIPGGVAPPQSVDDIPAFLDALLAALHRAAELVREGDIADPRGYLLARGLVSLVLTQVPADDEGRSPLAGLPQHTRDFLKSLADGGEWAALLANAEALAPDNPFALDLHRYSARALAELGHQAASDAVLATVAAAVRRLPGLSTMLDSDGAPFADDDTRAWLAAATAGGGPVAPPDPLARAVSEARALADAGELAQAVERLQRESSPDPVRRFRVRAEITELFLAAGHVRLGLVAANGLVQELDRHGLDRWDPKLAARALGLAVLARDRAVAVELAPDHHEPLLARLLDLDPREALLRVAGA